jgi:hypothetical protein
MEATTSIPAASPTGGRTTFLTVICILTFLGSGWGIVKSIRDFMTADTISGIASEVVEERESQIDKENVPGFVKKIIRSVNESIDPGSIRKDSIISLISNLLTLAGALLMWNLKRPGFYIYLAGVIVIVISPLLMGTLVEVIGGSIRGFIGVVFIVMYAVNLKYMSKPGSFTSSY